MQCWAGAATQATHLKGGKISDKLFRERGDAVGSADKAFLVSVSIGPASIHRMFLNARRVREIADYGIFEVIIEPTANMTVEEGRAFVTEINRIMHGK